MIKFKLIKINVASIEAKAQIS
jgi:hypothetical protein